MSACRCAGWPRPQGGRAGSRLQAQAKAPLGGEPRIGEIGIVRGGDVNDADDGARHCVRWRRGAFSAPSEPVAFMKTMSISWA